MDGPQSTQWLLWLAGALAAGLIEVASLDFFFLMIAGGALIASASAGAGLPGPLQVLIFAAASGGLILTVRPMLKGWAGRTPSMPMNIAALTGRGAKVLETVTEQTGRVKLAGEVWTARVQPGEHALEIGSDVHVVRIDGATAVVAPDHIPPHRLEEGRPTP
jgi:membrane protein implicated in regulation of membrane protease activity